MMVIIAHSMDGTANLTGGTIQNSQTISTNNGSFSAISIYNGSNVTLDGTTVKHNTNGIRNIYL